MICIGSFKSLQSMLPNLRFTDAPSTTCHGTRFLLNAEERRSICGRNRGMNKEHRSFAVDAQHIKNECRRAVNVLESKL